MPADPPSLSEVARRLDVSPATLRRWTREGIVPLREGRWTPAAVAQARIVARLRERGHSLDELREAAHSGRLAYGYMEDLFPPPAETMTLEDAARESGLEPELIRRIWVSAGFSSRALEDGISGDDLQLLRYMAAVVSAGFPREAFLQLVRVYGQALARIADAEVKLFHLFVHEPLIRDGHGGLAIAEEMEGLATELLPLASPIMDHVHQRWLQHFIEQDVVGHLELEVDDGTDLGRLRVGIAFADLAGYTRLTEDVGEEEARRHRRALRGLRRGLAARGRAGDQDDRRRGDGGRLGPVGARRLGGRLPAAVHASARCRASASTPAPRCTATATTSAAPSTSPRAWGRGRRAGRCS